MSAVVFVSNQMMVEAVVNMPANRVFLCCIVIAKLKAHWYLILKPDKQIHIGISKPAL
ncbi:MAG: hypothetical protein OEZ15_03555 [Gammaproteobacteria bacterium]|nr:hypothetical protein [Gammaproteobacteria bacterium]